jgi:hypothetical protein
MPTPSRGSRPHRHDPKPTRQEIPSLVGPVLRAHERAGQALHRQRVLRQAPVAGRHHRQPGPRRDAGRAGHHRRQTGRHPARHGADHAARSRTGAFDLEARPGRRAPEHRGAPDAARGRRRQAPAHRPLAQRPGRHRRAPVAARRDRPDRRPADELQTAPGRRGRAKRRRDPARLHPPAGGPAGGFGHHLLAYVEMFAATPSAWSTCAAASTACRWARRAGRHQLPAGPRARRRTLGMEGRVPEQPGRRQRPRLRDRVHRRRQPGAMVHISRLSARS